MAKFKTDSLYFFTYKEPITKHIKQWDSTPLVIPLSVNSTHLMAVNIHWLKLTDRKRFLNKIISLYKATPKLIYKELKKDFKYALKGIRTYLISGITKIEEIPNKQWGKIGLTHGKYGRKIIYK